MKQQRKSHSKVSGSDDSYPVQLAEEYEFFGTNLKIELDFNDSLHSVPPQNDPSDQLPAGIRPLAGSSISTNQGTDTDGQQNQNMKAT